jgi:hypothetical protein
MLQNAVDQPENYPAGKYQIHPKGKVFSRFRFPGFMDLGNKGHGSQTGRDQSEHGDSSHKQSILKKLLLP